MGGFKLTKWLSPSERVMLSIPAEDKSKVVHSDMPSCGPEERVLGICWNVSCDEFFFKIDVPDTTVTKRKVLAVTNSLYDPLGFVSPVVLLARLLYSEICSQQRGWDDPVTGQLQTRWLAWAKGLVNLQAIKIPRSYKPKVDGAIQYQLHFFSDASNLARGTVCYLRMILPDSSVRCNLLMSKCYIRGCNKTTIPRMELEAALDSIKLSRVIKQELDLLNCPCIYWTDSTIVLHSLRADCKRFSLFPRNRLQRILMHSKTYDWGYVNTKINPADKLTRGITAKRLVKDLNWLTGPNFLLSSPDKWPVGVSPMPTDTVYQSFDMIIFSSLLAFEV